MNRDEEQMMILLLDGLEEWLEGNESEAEYVLGLLTQKESLICYNWLTDFRSALVDYAMTEATKECIS